MATYSRICEYKGEFSLLLDSGTVPADETVVDSGHEPNGYFWEGVAHYLAPDLMAKLVTDSEAGMFVATGTRADVQALQQVLEPVFADRPGMGTLIAQAEARGVDFDD